MSFARFLLPFLLLLLAGCADPAATEDPFSCTDIPTDLIVDEVRDTSLLVDDGSMVLHASKATIMLRTDAGCQEIMLSDVSPGDHVGHNANEIAMSYPAQAWPTLIVVAPA